METTKTKFDLVKYDEATVHEICLIVDNTWDIYREVMWCYQAMAKKIRRGVHLDSDHLVHSSVMQTIIREAIKAGEITGVTKYDRAEAARRLADDMIEAAKYIAMHKPFVTITK